MSILRRIANLFHRSELDQDIDAELRSHIEMRTADNIAAGLSPEQARRDAVLRFGSRSRHRLFSYLHSYLAQCISSPVCAARWKLKMNWEFKPKLVRGGSRCRKSFSRRRR